ncbi:hypothetical protein E5288_WYG004291 [Bos mutus]|uniref:Uncharacterized protein n=1 Tax=Bos mutus TaxID=72004 RepID=A0A6B0R4G9_9CETA|nr:hypothetical protein [Bos mutus]
MFLLESVVLGSPADYPTLSIRRQYRVQTRSKEMMQSPGTFYLRRKHPESTFYLENANGTDQQIPVTQGRTSHRVQVLKMLTGSKDVEDLDDAFQTSCTSVHSRAALCRRAVFRSVLIFLGNSKCVDQVTDLSKGVANEVGDGYVCLHNACPIMKMLEDTVSLDQEGTKSCRLSKEDPGSEAGLSLSKEQKVCLSPEGLWGLRAREELTSGNFGKFHKLHSIADDIQRGTALSPYTLNVEISKWMLFPSVLKIPQPMAPALAGPRGPCPRPSNAVRNENLTHVTSILVINEKEDVLLIVRSVGRTLGEMSCALLCSEGPTLLWRDFTGAPPPPPSVCRAH